MRSAPDDRDVEGIGYARACSEAAGPDVPQTSGGPTLPVLMAKSATGFASDPEHLADLHPGREAGGVLLDADESIPRSLVCWRGPDTLIYEGLADYDGHRPSINCDEVGFLDCTH